MIAFERKQPLICAVSLQRSDKDEYTFPSRIIIGDELDFYHYGLLTKR
jgi:hypothetical protein